MSVQNDPFKHKLLTKEQLSEILQPPIEPSLFINHEIYDIDEKEFSYRILDSIEYDYSIEIEFLIISEETGETSVSSFWGWVQKTDYINDLIKMVNDADSIEVLFTDIVAVRKK